ncbi:hypothetical protein RSAG8_10793, partial [Rhizoctonia solani AG-8 WAC10335]
MRDADHALALHDAPVSCFSLAFPGNSFICIWALLFISRLSHCFYWRVRGFTRRGEHSIRGAQALFTD